VPVVNETVATPLAFVVLVGEANEPPVPVLLHVTVLPEVDTALPLASANCAVMVTAVPATGLLSLDVTRYCVAVPAVVVMFPLVPVRLIGLLLSVAVTVYTVPATVPVVNETVATPLTLVVLVPDENEPPLPVLLHVTILPAVDTGLLLASASCAVIVTALPAAGLLLLDVTRYFVAGPAVTVIVMSVP